MLGIPGHGAAACEGLDPRRESQKGPGTDGKDPGSTSHCLAAERCYKEEPAERRGRCQLLPGHPSLAGERGGSGRAETTLSCTSDGQHIPGTNCSAPQPASPGHLTALEQGGLVGEG